MAKASTGLAFVAFGLLFSLLMQAAGVTEELKARDPMKWVQLMNNLRNAAEETILTELIYS